MYFVEPWIHAIEERGYNLMATITVWSQWSAVIWKRNLARHSMRFAILLAIRWYQIDMLRLTMTNTNQLIMHSPCWNTIRHFSRELVYGRINYRTMVRLGEVTSPIFWNWARSKQELGKATPQCPTSKISTWHWITIQTPADLIVNWVLLRH